MQLKVLGSGSSGNCYLLEGKTSTLIIECGVNIKEIKQALNFDLSKVDGAVVTHEHKDHCKSVKDVLAAGINVWTSEGTRSAFKIESHRLNNMMPMKSYKIGEFEVMGFNVEHDCAQPFGFLIKHLECGTVLFITDSYYVKYKFPSLNNIIVEANFCPEIVTQRLVENKIHGKVRNRVLESHMSIDTCSQLLAANDLSQVNNIVLIHLSDGNSDAKKFKNRISQETGKNVHIADKGLLINFSKTPF